ncbi:MAG TPA: GlsB/YeaQ/YmgE family stress response membrane protein [Candidatus Babeliales bacterium]|nr:GlsB/YeaQ/YmgE family stress response membrane protein [Candidatus Babeliales bacterium]
MIVLAWILLGLVIGILARRVVVGESPGVAADAIVGTLGAAAGGCLDGLFRGRLAADAVPSMVSALIGAVVLLWVARAIRSKVQAP